jgi:prevent-host-death family protein
MMCYVSVMSDTAAPQPPARPGTGNSTGADAAMPARRIGVRELRQHASVYIDLVERGYTVDITNRGRLVAQLVPVRELESPLERLIAAGVIEPAEDAGDLLDIEPGPPAPPGQPTASEILRQLREEERY